MVDAVISKKASLLVAVVESYSGLLQHRFQKEVDRLIKSGGVGEDTPINTVIVVALENLADKLNTGNLRSSKEYRNLKTF